MNLLEQINCAISNFACFMWGPHLLIILLAEMLAISLAISLLVLLMNKLAILLAISLIIMLAKMLTTYIVN